LGRIVQLESKRKPAVESPLTPELKDFIDRAIVPLLVKQYLAEMEKNDHLAQGASGGAHSLSTTAAFQFSGDAEP
jgi:hypothetical protein